MAWDCHLSSWSGGRNDSAISRTFEKDTVSESRPVTLLLQGCGEPTNLAKGSFRRSNFVLF